MGKTPLPHQREAIPRLAEFDQLALLWEMRLGKCFMSLQWLKAHAAFPALIVSPLSVCRTWANEAREEGFTPILLRGDRDHLGDLLECNRPIFITNYETLLRQRWVCSRGWEAVVLDESPRIRNPKAQITKVCLRSFPHVEHRLILSGCVRPESDLDFFCQYAFLHWGGFMGCRDYWTWRHRFFNPAGFGYDWRAKPGALQQIYNAADELSLKLTRKEAGVGSEKVRSRRYCILPPAVRAAYRDATTDWAIGDQEAKYAPVISGWLRKLCGGIHPAAPHNAKLELLGELIDGELRGKPFLVWCSYLDEIERVRSFLQGKGLRVARIQGSTKVDIRDQRVESFQVGRLDALVLHPTCAKYGLNCSRADYAVYYSRLWEHEPNTQSEDRIISPVKTEPVGIIDLVVEDSVEEEVLAVYADKRLSANAFMSAVLDRLKGITCRTKKVRVRLRQSSLRGKTPALGT